MRDKSLLTQQIEEYKRKYYTNALLKGIILSSTLLISVFIIFNSVEYFSSLNTFFRAGLFFSFLLVFLFSFYFWILAPILQLFKLKKHITNFEAAQQIGKYFPEINDKLLNTLQLESTSNQADTDLVRESITQKTKNLTIVRFKDAINYKSNQKYLRYFLPSFAFLIILFLIIPQLFTESTARIINYSEDYKEKVPFTFIILNKNLQSFQNDNFTLNVKLEGIAIPNKVEIITSNDRKLRMTNKNDNTFEFSFKKVQRDIIFRFEASGFNSKEYTLVILKRPSLQNFSTFLDFPDYVGKEDQRVTNTGNLVVSEGTKIIWDFNTSETDKLDLFFAKENSTLKAISNKKNTFTFEKTVRKPDTYQVRLTNQHSANKDIIEYYLNVIPDEYPTISISQSKDSVLFETLAIFGNIADDYGINALKLNYRIIKLNEEGRNKPFVSQDIDFNPSLINQSFFQKLDITQFHLEEDDRLEYFVEVWDNDGVNGSKKSKTSIYEFRLPSKREIKNILEEENQQNQDQMNKTLKQAEKLSRDIEDIQDKLKGKRKLDWQDKKALENLINKNEKLDERIQNLQELSKTFNQKQEKFNQQNEELSKKAQQLQKLMDELLDEETKKLYEELNKLLEQNFVNKNLQDLLKNIDIKQENLENELERALELFKKLQFELKMTELSKELEQIAKKQEQLSEKTKNADKDQNENLKKEQEDISEEFEDIEKSLEELNQLNDSLENSKNLESFEEQKQEIKEQQQNAIDQLQKQQQKKASDSQKKGAQQMKQMAQQMQQMQQSAQMQQISENYDDLRQILENLMTLSFGQENLMLQFRDIRRIDPKFVELSQQQLKLKDDSELIKDSLISLSKRVFQIESFVTREVNELNKYMDESIEAIRKRTPEIASSKQQFAMTSMNNLALLLNDILQQMQQQMSQNMSGKQMSEQQQGSPSMSDLQQQLNKKIQDLKRSGKSGRELSEELAKLAAEQEMIRNSLQKEIGKQKGGQKGDGQEGHKELLQEMEKTEEDLVNKKITQETINRQKEILTRLLESEKAQRERELDNERKAETAKKQEKENPKIQFDEYIKLKEAQIELLKTIPASLNKYYKKEVNEYFNGIKN